MHVTSSIIWRALEEFPDVDRRSCRLLGPIALVVQALMGILVILSLVYKRHREKPKRPWKIWIFDVSKQIAGQMFVHGVNVLISDLVAHHSSGNPCVLYFLNILIDTTFGVAAIYLILNFATHLLSEKLQLKGFQSGQYGDPPSILFWARQAAVYVLALTTMKLLVVGLFALWPGIFKIGEWLLSWTGGGDAVQVIFVMGIFPIGMNILQFWLIDSIVKASATQAGVSLPYQTPRNSSDNEPLFRASESDDDNDEVFTSRRHDVENPHPLSSSLTTSDEDPKGSYSGSVAPHQEDSAATHSYPPSASTSPVLASTSLTSHRMHSPAPRRMSRKRSPPPPLLPRSPLQPAIVSLSPMYTAELHDPTRDVEEPDIPHPLDLTHAPEKLPEEAAAAMKDWNQPWGDADDWANRVGEEDWTGRRLESRRVAVGEVWNEANRHVEVGS